MSRLDSNDPGAPRTLLVGLDFTDPPPGLPGGADLEELDRLARSAGFLPVGRATQRRARPRAGTLLGRGKLAEIREQVAAREATLVLLACDLPYPVTARLGEELGVRVMDRSELILEIFARHATSQEGRLQVRMARLEHELHRLLAEEKDLDRQGGGIGVPGGPGESAARLARRRIHRKRRRLGQALEVVRRRREARRRRRLEGGMARVALAGYTNAGKSTLLNALVGAEVTRAADQLFTTLGTTTRRVRTPGGRPLLVSDTVGFLEDLPHHLVAAFESTLAEATDAELTLVVVEADPARAPARKAAVDAVLDRLGSDPERRLLVLSKADQATAEELEALRAAWPGAAVVAAREGRGLGELLGAVEARLGAAEPELELLLPHARLELAAELFAAGRVREHRWGPEGVRLRAQVPAEQEGRWAAFRA